LRTLETGIKLLEKNIVSPLTPLHEEKGTVLSGKIAFTLYDTFGFPLDLTELILRENNMTVNLDEFNAEMKIQKDRARNAAAIETGDWITVREGDSVFVGYDYTSYDTEILRYRKVKQKNQEYYQIVLSKTPFYAEMGGQVGDCGSLSLNPFPTERDFEENRAIRIIDTKKENNLAVHIATKLPEDVTETFTATIDVENAKQPNVTTRQLTCCTKHYAKCWAHMWSKKVRSSVPKRCVLTSRIFRNDEKRNTRRRRNYQSQNPRKLSTSGKTRYANCGGSGYGRYGFVW